MCLFLEGNYRLRWARLIFNHHDLMLLIVADFARADDLMLLIPASQSASRPFMQLHPAIPPFCHHAMQKDNWGEVGV